MMFKTYNKQPQKRYRIIFFFIVKFMHPSQQTWNSTEESKNAVISEITHNKTLLVRV